ncbi:MAG: AMP-binding protein [Candidatus Acidiferrum sp.]
MANFLENIFANLQRAGDRLVLQEVRGGDFVGVSGKQLLEQVAIARAFIRRSGVQPGDRCAVLGANSIQWAAIDLALMAEGVIVVPLYSRQAPAELIVMMRDATPKLLFAGDPGLGDAVARSWPELRPYVLFSEALASHSADTGISGPPNPRKSEDLLTIIYTSGTSGDPKGVCLTTANLDHMISCTSARLDQLMEGEKEPDRIFHYLPFSFAGSWILLLSSLHRTSTLTLSTDLNKLVDEIRLSAPDYFMNVPTLLERVRRGVEEAISKRDSLSRRLYRNARLAWERQDNGKSGLLNSFWRFTGERLIFSKIRERFGPNLKALICGSAPLSSETQRFFQMLRIPVLQAYGLTETTGICTMDDPHVSSEPGRVGVSIPGIEMTTGEDQEIIVRGPNIFPGYWNRPEETAKVLRDGWFHTGDQGEVNSHGNWRISGRIKNLIILNSGHNIGPEPIEEGIAEQLPGTQQVVVVGNGRGYLCALVTGTVDADAVQAALHTVNSELPHYRQVRNFMILKDVFTPESGLLTANGKLRRDVINSRYRIEIEAMYAKNAAAAGGGK